MRFYIAVFALCFIAAVIISNPYPTAPDWYAAIKRPEWLTVIVAVLALFVIAWQSWETRKAAQATRDGINLQEANFQQWVDVRNWQVTPSKQDEFEMAFDVVNSTDWPLTALHTYIRIGHLESFRRHDVLLAPKEAYTIKGLYVAVSAELHMQYISSSAMLPALIVVTYKNCLQRIATQERTGLIHFSATGVGFQLEDLPNMRVGRWYKLAKKVKQEAD